MRVNSVISNILRHRVVMIGAISLVAVSVFVLASSFTGHPDHDSQSRHTNLVIRQIGHQVLLQAGDTRSRVLPVREISDGTFLLTFARNLVFNHDSLVALTQRMLSKEAYPSGYTVTVHDCSNRGIVYGFQINQSSPDVIACTGRIEPRGCYTIEIAFRDLYKSTSGYTTLAFSGTLLLLGFALLIGHTRKYETREISAPVRHTTRRSQPDLVPLGQFQFDKTNHQLVWDTTVIPLTEKECRVLDLLQQHFGELIPRDTLLEKIWVSEGVFTGRSLDMFVSKLRKKLRHDSALRITNVHGKGYKLEQLAM